MRVEYPSDARSEEEIKKARYFSDFALRHFGDMKVLAKGGVLGRENADWRNVSEHCLVEAVGADVLAEALGADRDGVTRAALLHDWYKRREVEAMREAGGGGGYQLASGEDERLLREYGIPENIIKLAHANIPERADADYLADRSVEEKVVHFMDMMTLGSDIILDYEERVRDAERKPVNIEFSESFRPRYGNKSLFELQREAVAFEQAEFERQLGIGKGMLPNFIRERIRERIGAFAAAEGK